MAMDQPSCGTKPMIRKKYDADQGDGRVLPVHVGGRALLDRRGDLLHPFVAGGKREDPAHRPGAVEDGQHGASEGEVESMFPWDIASNPGKVNEKRNRRRRDAAQSTPV